MFFNIIFLFFNVIKQKKMTNKETVAKTQKATQEKPSIFNIYVDRVEYAVVDGKAVGTAEAKELVKNFRETKTVDANIKSLVVFTDRFNYKVGFKDGAFLYEKTCQNAQIRDGKLVAPIVVNPRRNIIAVRSGRTVMSVSGEVFERNVESEVVTQDVAEASNEYYYDTVTKEYRVSQFPINFDFFNAVTTYQIVKKDDEFVIYYGKMTKEDEGKYKVVYGSSGTKEQIQRSYKRFMKDLETEEVTK